MTSGSSRPTSISPTCKRSALGCFSSLAIRAVTTPVILGRRTISAAGNPSSANRSAISDVSLGSATNSRNQLNGTRMLSLSTQLREKLDVAADEAANIVDFVAREAQTLDAEAKRPPGIDATIVAHRMQHVGMYHARAAEFD